MRKILQFLFLAPAVSLALVAGSNAFAGELVEIDFDSANFSAPIVINNAYWPLTPGTYFVYFAESEDGCEWNVVDVTYEVHTVEFGPGMADDLDTVEVLDIVWLDESEDCNDSAAWVPSSYDPTDPFGSGPLAANKVTEYTWDWYAQDDGGNIWYLGEETYELFPEPGDCDNETTDPEFGYPACRDGSFEAGKEDLGEGEAEGGLIMLANPQKGDRYQQELDVDNAEDWAKVLNFVPVEDEEDCLKTKEWSPLEPGAVEHKYYCPNVEDEGTNLLVEEVSGGQKVFVELQYVDTYDPEPEP